MPPAGITIKVREPDAPRRSAASTRPRWARSPRTSAAYRPPEPYKGKGVEVRRRIRPPQGRQGGGVAAYHERTSTTSTSGGASGATGSAEARVGHGRAAAPVGVPQRGSTSTRRSSTTCAASRWSRLRAARTSQSTVEGKGTRRVSDAVGKLLAAARQGERGSTKVCVRSRRLPLSRARQGARRRRPRRRPELLGDDMATDAVAVAVPARAMQPKSEFIERVIQVNRCAKVVKGGRRFSFNAIVAVGDGKGRVGVGSARPTRSPTRSARRARAPRRGCSQVPVTQHGSIPHQMVGHFGAGEVLLKPASPGTGVIAGGGVRAVLEVAGIQNVLTKCLGSRNPHNLVKATVRGAAPPAPPVRRRGDARPDGGRDLRQPERGRMARRLRDHAGQERERSHVRPGATRARARASPAAARRRARRHAPDPRHGLQGPPPREGGGV